MGCKGSRIRDPSEGGVNAPKIVTATDVGDFKVLLERSPGTTFGLSVEALSDDTIRVHEIRKDGLAFAWNTKNVNTPEVQMQTGDIIIGVNNVFRNKDDMMKELKEKSCVLTVERQVLEGDEDALADAAAPLVAAPPQLVGTSRTPSKDKGIARPAAAPLQPSAAATTAAWAKGDSEKEPLPETAPQRCEKAMLSMHLSDTLREIRQDSKEYGDSEGDRTCPCFC
eukprot:TRINITY_DN16237_c0_g1_i1.p1 TRINITY_DN16237_c0_g1~~TRINITY_DN16237_c0_g1_i1.p1  ORF type:complete len:225 (+),score=64.93 TRINITY_DN16237_c0_g1_i1:61-735(+)